MKKSKSFQKKTEKLQGTEQQGLLVALFGNSAEVENEAGEIIRCHLRKNQLPVITGDQVLWLPEEDNAGVIVDHLPRKSLLSRHEPSGRSKLLAANIDAIIIVSSPPPSFSEYLIDRYIVAAENVNITPIILLNKMDLLTDHNRLEITELLATYKKIGYTVLLSSTRTEDGMASLKNFLHDKTCVLVGASGVGKSSIISALVPDLEIKIGEVSDAGAGKHTTTMTRLYHLPHNANLIDSPGVREFALGNLSKQEILRGFIEFNDYMRECKFRNCLHLQEPSCAVRKAIEEGKISVNRFESYKELMLAE